MTSTEIALAALGIAIVAILCRALLLARRRAASIDPKWKPTGIRLTQPGKYDERAAIAAKLHAASREAARRRLEATDAAPPPRIVRIRSGGE